MFHFLDHKTPHSANSVSTLPFCLPHLMKVSPLLDHSDFLPCSQVRILLKGFLLTMIIVAQISFSSRLWYTQLCLLLNAFSVSLGTHSFPAPAVSQWPSSEGLAICYPDCFAPIIPELHPVRCVFSITVQKWLLSSSPNDILLVEFTVIPFLLN